MHGGYAKSLEVDILAEINCARPCNLIPKLIWGISLQGKSAVQKELDFVQTTVVGRCKEIMQKEGNGG